MSEIIQFFCHQFGMQDFYQVSKHDVRMDRPWLPVIISSSRGAAQIVVIHAICLYRLGIFEIRIYRLQLV